MEHLNLEKIHSYMEKQETGKNSTEIEEHLVTCEKCYRIYLALLSFEQPLGRSFKEEKATTSCPEDWEIGALIQEELPSDISKKISIHLKDCGFCIDRAAHYYQSLKYEKAPVEVPQEWKLRALQALKVEKTAEEPGISFIERIIDFFRNLTFPVPVAVSYATALLVVAALVWISVPAQPKFITIAASEKVVLRDSEIPSAFGFSGAGETKEVKMMEFSLKGNDIVFSWEPLEGVVEYTFSLKEGDRIIQDKTAIRRPSFSIKKVNIEKERVYSWIITGRTKEMRYLEYTGDFILTK